MTSSKSYILDMDGVIVHGDHLIPGAQAFIEHLQSGGIKYLFLTNNSRYTRATLQERTRAMGLDVPADRYFTSAMATARFLNTQRPHGTAYVVGESGLLEALQNMKYTLTDENPDYVVLGETFAYDLDSITRAIRLISAGARFIATNPDPYGPGAGGMVPACGAVAALISAATGVDAYFVGKPNPLMMRTALRYLGEHSETTIMVGDRMDTDILAGTEAGMETILVLSGVTQREDVARFPYRPTRILNSVADIEP